MIQIRAHSPQNPVADSGRLAELVSRRKLSEAVDFIIRRTGLPADSEEAMKRYERNVEKFGYSIDDDINFLETFGWGACLIESPRIAAKPRTAALDGRKRDRVGRHLLAVADRIRQEIEAERLDRKRKHRIRSMRVKV